MTETQQAEVIDETDITEEDVKEGFDENDL